MFLIIPKSRQQEETSRIIGTSGEREDVPESMPKHLRGPTRVQNACDECRIRKIKVILPHLQPGAERSGTHQILSAMVKILVVAADRVILFACSISQKQRNVSRGQ
jgi:hypothetical protein